MARTIGATDSPNREHDEHTLHMNESQGNIYRPAQEFTAREKQLPPDTRSLTPDMAIAARQAQIADRTPPGEPALDFNVRSIFDSRPVNAQDFNIAAFFEGPTTTSFTEAVITFVVPDGSICVLRKTRTWSVFAFGSMGPAIERTDVLASFLLDGSVVQYNQDIPVGPEQDDLLDTFILADERQVVGVRLVSGVGVPWPQNTTVWAHFYGNFLAKSGRPKQFEIANPAGALGPARVPPMYNPPPPRANVAQRPAYTPPVIAAPAPAVIVPNVPAAPPIIYDMAHQRTKPIARKRVLLK